MIDYALIAVHIRRARVQQSVYLGELIADGILAVWSDAKRLAATASEKVSELVQTPDSYSTSMPRRF